ncbi:MAG: TIR domain-containing protein [Verrucomicrobia bacterium]|nr:TIR domain-containing protein [Verrucomicrobiota bacterium]
MPSPVPDSSPPAAVFLSYASQDAEAARRICEALRAAGVEVWFDQSELRGGDSWDQKIRRQIRECTLFLPVVSVNTQARREGYFRLEWKLAEDRTHLMAKGTPFLVPVCIDETKDWDALVPDSFMSVQWTRLPAGETPPAFCERVRHLLAGGTTPPMSAPRAQARPAEGPAPGAPPARRRLAPFAWIAGGVVAGVMIVALILGRRQSPPDVSGPAKTPAPPVAPATATAAGFPRDPELRRARQLLLSLDAIAEDHALADDIVKPLLAARPNDPEVVTVAAEVSQETLVRGFDLTPSRRAQAQRLTERAVQLAPDAPEALAALGRYLLFTNTQLSRAEELLRRAIQLKPAEPRFHRALYYILAISGRDAEAEAYGEKMVAQFPTDPLVAYDIARRYKDVNNLVEMERWFDRTIALSPVAFALVWKAWIMLEVHGDVAAMKQWLARVPERQRLNSRTAYAHYVHGMITGEVAPALAILNALPDAWMTDFDFTGPRALLIGDLLRRDGREDLARLQYEAALVEMQRTTAKDPTDLRPRRALTLVLEALGRHDEARANLRLIAQSLPRPYRWTINQSWWNGVIRASLLLGEREQAIGLLRDAVAAPASRVVLRNHFQLDPRMAPLRDDREIAALLGAPEEKRPPETAGGDVASLVARSKLMYTRINYTREDLATAEELARRATEIGPDSAAAWGVRAGVHATVLYRNWDVSEKRKQNVQTFASRALGLNPAEPEALWALGHLLRRQGAGDQALPYFRRAYAADPTNNRFARALGTALSFDGKEEEGRAILRDAVRRDPRDPILRYDLALTYDIYAAGSEKAPSDVASALEHLEAGLAVQPLAALLNAKAVVQGGWRGDLPALRSTLVELEKLPIAERAEDRAVFIAMWGALLDRDPARVAATAALTAKNYFEDTVVHRRPKHWSLALARLVEGKENLARLEWQRAETVLRGMLREDPHHQFGTLELATTLAWLGRTEEAAGLLRPIEAAWREELVAQRARGLAHFYAAAGDAPRTIEYLRRSLDTSVFVTRKTVPLDPWWDKVRGSPEFAALLRP